MMGINYGDRITGLSNVGWHLLPWQICEDYLSPVSNGQVYHADGRKYTAWRKYDIELAHDYYTSNACSTMAKVVSYLASFGILPAIAFVIKFGYRAWYANKLVVKEQPLCPPLKAPEEQWKSAFSSFEKTIQGIDLDQLELDEKQYAAALSCPITMEVYQSGQNLKPVFIIEEGTTCSAKAAVGMIARLEKEKARISQELQQKRLENSHARIEEEIATIKVILGKPFSSVTYCDNIGHLTQMRKNTNDEIYWLEPITNHKLGEKGFMLPYFFPGDGHTYDLETFKKYCKDYRANNPKAKRIPSPVNPKVTFARAILYPNRTFFTVTEHQPAEGTFESVSILD